LFYLPLPFQCVKEARN